MKLKFDSKLNAIEMKFEAKIWNYSYFIEVLAEAVYISIDPFMRGHMMQSPCGVIMIGGQVAKYLLSNHVWININQDQSISIDKII